MTTPLRYRCLAQRTPLVEKSIEILARSARERLGVELAVISARARKSRPDLVLDIQPGLGAEGFRIAPEGVAGACRITGNDERGLLYGIGKYLRICRPGNDAGAGLEAGWQGVCVPKLPVRGMYFATHFHNFYHDAPLAEVERYVEDLALWGCNTLSVWFDMHHYASLQDPAAQAMIQRLHAVLKTANRVGMGAGLVTLANEAYHSSPADLRAEPFPAHYHVEICPSRPGGMELILRWRREMIEAFADLEIEHFWIWPYDQGGCKCPACKPWGGNGFVRNAEAVGRLVRTLLPRAKTVISTWEFGYWEGDPEWEQFYAVLAQRPAWADYLMAEGHGDFPPYILKHGPPPGYPLLNFPEISMSGMDPWGGFGANLQPVRLQKVWNTCRSMLSGGYPYSEGIFEDLNKIVCLQLYWDPDRRVEDIVREYAAGEFGPDAAEDVTRAVYLLEENMGHAMADTKILNAWNQRAEADAGAADGALYRLPKVKEPTKPLGLLDAAAQRMPEVARAGWRWRMLWLRAALDLELHQSGGRPTARADAFFDEVCRISHAEGAEWPVSPMGRRHLRRLLKKR